MGLDEILPVTTATTVGAICGAIAVALGGDERHAAAAFVAGAVAAEFVRRWLRRP